MKISHIISSIDNASGGPSRSVTHTIQAILKQEDTLKIDLNTLISENPIIKKFDSKNGQLNFHNQELLGFSKTLQQELNNINTDIFHGHGLWQYPVHQMAQIARQRNIPYIITPRGMLDVWSIKHKGFKKKLALKLFQDKDLRKATIIHATSKQEALNIRSLGYKNPVAIIPNGIPLKKLEFTKKTISNEKKMLFLSRIVKNKGVEELIEAWSMLNDEVTKHWTLEIVGNGQDIYIKKLRNIIKLKKLQHQIVISEPIFGAEKMKKFQEANLFVLPSYSENFGIVVAEALACGAPVITTKGTPWEELNSHQAGWWIEIGVEPLKKTLETAMQTNESELISMGVNGRKLIENKYSMETVAKQMLALYQWILAKNNKPDFIDII
ncbi:glycosyltransferase [Algibacter mikhailovii]|uniref:Glycosyl transferase family 1 n=1 Tax=Algibacter mikhailovii TaxID=425498 RepID=A0A918RCC2_9FLAO|nr:glycosyltransferase [Algibacter mikhailovii]GGZ93583.1 glycosyl transferase family 1 [Algibacter mikhailovii]